MINLKSKLFHILINNGLKMKNSISKIIVAALIAMFTMSSVSFAAPATAPAKEVKKATTTKTVETKATDKEVKKDAKACDKTCKDAKKDGKACDKTCKDAKKDTKACTDTKDAKGCKDAKKCTGKCPDKTK